MQPLIIKLVNFLDPEMANATLLLFVVVVGTCLTTCAGECNPKGNVTIYRSAEIMQMCLFLFCFAVGTGTNSSSCKKCAEYNLTHGTASYSDPLENNFGPREEGSQAVFACDAGYQLSGARNVTCREGNWIGAIPTCEDIDECNSVDCGGSSECVDGIGKYTCECAEGWFGGGINTKCEKPRCECTGNKGYWKARTTTVNGQIKFGYDHGPTFGEVCAAHDKDKLYENDPTTAWSLEKWYANGVDNKRKYSCHGNKLLALIINSK